MKSFFIVVLLFFSFVSFSQDWKDSLSSARKLYKEGKFVESFEKYKSTKKIAPKNVDLSEEMAQSAYKSNEFKQAEKLYSKSKASKKSSLEKAKTYHNIGNSQLKQKNYKEAVAAYKESLRNNPNDEQTRYNLAEALKKQKKEEEKKDNKSEDNQTKDKRQKTDENKEEPKEKNKPQDKKNEENKPSEEKSEENQQSKLNDKKTDRMLDDLVKKEMETKKKMGGQKSKNKKSKTGKDW